MNRIGDIQDEVKKFKAGINVSVIKEADVAAVAWRRARSLPASLAPSAAVTRRPSPLVPARILKEEAPCPEVSTQPGRLIFSANLAKSEDKILKTIEKLKLLDLPRKSVSG